MPSNPNRLRCSTQLKVMCLHTLPNFFIPSSAKIVFLKGAYTIDSMSQALFHNALPSSNLLRAVSEGAEAGAPARCDAIHACVAGFALKMPLKLSRY